jgi:hypothetical protein
MTRPRAVAVQRTDSWRGGGSASTASTKRDAVKDRLVQSRCKACGIRFKLADRLLFSFVRNLEYSYYGQDAVINC